MNRDSEEYSTVPLVTTVRPDDVVGHLTGRDQATPDLVGPIGATDARTPEPDEPGALLLELPRLSIVNNLLIRCLNAGQEAPAGSIARSTLLEVACGLARDQMRQNRKVLSGETAITAISGLIDETLAAATAAGGDRVLRATLIDAASSLSRFLSLGAILKEDGYADR